MDTQSTNSPHRCRLVFTRCSYLIFSKLPFGTPIDQVCPDGILHPRLKELFVYGATSLADETSIIGRHRAVLSALRGGPRGLGSLSTRLALKNAVESSGQTKGQEFPPFLKATSTTCSCSTDKEASTPPGAALWLLRLFFGRLPVPLLTVNRWRQLGRQCSVVSRRTCACACASSVTSDFGSTANAQLINAAVKCLQNSSQAEKAVLKALVELMSKVGGGGPALLSLVDFFVPSLVGGSGSRVRLADEVTHQARSMLIFLCCHWSEISGDKDGSCALFRDDVIPRSPPSPRSLQSSLRSTTEFGERQGPLERPSVSWTDPRQSEALSPSRILRVGERNKSLVATPLLENSEERCQNSSQTESANDADSSKESLKDSRKALSRGESRCWLTFRSLFGNRGRASMSSIPSATAVKYEPIADGKHTWTL